MKTILLTKGQVAIVDDADHAVLSRYKWCCSGCGSRLIYAVGTVNGRVVSMHRFLVQPPTGYEVHHRDSNTLNNQRDNLQAITRRAHLAFNGPRSHGTLGYKGVTHYRNKARPNLEGRFIAQIQDGGEHYTLGLFHTAEEAARAYDAKALELFGEFAYLNFPSDTSKVRDTAANGG